MIALQREKQKYAGPLFIVGVGRSGTKLLRDLLNKNPKIGIPIIETGFIPYMFEHYSNQPGFIDVYRFKQFYKELSRTSFFLDFKRRGYVLSWQDLSKCVDKGSLTSVFEFILKFYAPEGRDQGFVWGDKTPVYLNHMILLKKYFPEAKFIHIFRDPRDYCLSIKKSSGKSMYRAAEDWREQIQSSLADAPRLAPDYLQISYESLLTNPEEILRRICLFIEVDFNNSMLRPLNTTEKLGDARGQDIIVAGNLRKYKSQLSPDQIKRIEEIVEPIARVLNYEIGKEICFQPLHPYEKRMFTAYDGWMSIKYHISEYGFLLGLYRLIHWHSHGSWLAKWWRRSAYPNDPQFFEHIEEVTKL
jgi:hypothetical protein